MSNLKKGMKTKFKPVSVEISAEQELKKRGITVNQLVKKELSKFTGTKKIKRIYDCPFLCSLKKRNRCISDFWKECPHLKNDKKYTKVVAKLEVELMGKPDKKLKLIKQHDEIVVPTDADITKEVEEEE